MGHDNRRQSNVSSAFSRAFGQDRGRQDAKDKDRQPPANELNANNKRPRTDDRSQERSPVAPRNRPEASSPTAPTAQGTTPRRQPWSDAQKQLPSSQASQASNLCTDSSLGESFKELLDLLSDRVISLKSKNEAIKKNKRAFSSQERLHYRPSDYPSSMELLDIQSKQVEDEIRRAERQIGELDVKILSAIQPVLQACAGSAAPSAVAEEPAALDAKLTAMQSTMKKEMEALVKREVMEAQKSMKELMSSQMSKMKESLARENDKALNSMRKTMTRDNEEKLDSLKETLATQEQRVVSLKETLSQQEDEKRESLRKTIAREQDRKLNSLRKRIVEEEDEKLDSLRKTMGQEGEKLQALRKKLAQEEEERQGSLRKMMGQEGEKLQALGEKLAQQQDDKLNSLGKMMGQEGEKLQALREKLAQQQEERQDSLMKMMGQEGDKLQALREKLAQEEDGRLNSLRETLAQQEDQKLNSLRETLIQEQKQRINFQTMTLVQEEEKRINSLKMTLAQEEEEKINSLRTTLTQETEMQIAELKALIAQESRENQDKIAMFEKALVDEMKKRGVLDQKVTELDARVDKTTSEKAELLASFVDKRQLTQILQHLSDAQDKKLGKLEARLNPLEGLSPRIEELASLGDTTQLAQKLQHLSAAQDRKLGKIEARLNPLEGLSPRIEKLASLVDTTQLAQKLQHLSDAQDKKLSQKLQHLSDAQDKKLGKLEARLNPLERLSPRIEELAGRVGNNSKLIQEQSQQKLASQVCDMSALIRENAQQQDKSNKRLASFESTISKLPIDEIENMPMTVARMKTDMQTFMSNQKTAETVSDDKILKMLRRELAKNAHETKEMIRQIQSKLRPFLEQERQCRETLEEQVHDFTRQLTEVQNEGTAMKTTYERLSEQDEMCITEIQRLNEALNGRIDDETRDLHSFVSGIILQLQHMSSWQNNFNTRGLYREIVAHINATLPNGALAQIRALRQRIERAETRMSACENALSNKRRKLPNGGSMAIGYQEDA